MPEDQELTQQKVEQEAENVRLKNDSDKVLNEKIAGLRLLLGDNYVDGKEDSRDYIPILNTREQKLVKKKLLALIDQL